MKNLNPNERRLLALFLGACGVGLLLFAGKFAWGMHESFELKLEDLRNQRDANAEWIQKKPIWEARAEWMRNHPAPEFPEASAGSDLLSKLQASLGGRSGKILSQELEAPASEGNFDTVTAHLKLSGAFPAIARWLFDLQQADAYLGVRKVTFKSDGEPPQVTCDLEITQYFRGK